MLTVNDIQNLIELLNEAPEVAELSVTATDGSEITLKRSGSARRSFTNVQSSAGQDDSNEGPQGDAPIENTAPALSAVAATMVGIFHLAKPPVEYGAHIKAGQRVGAIESMRLMNDVVSTADGTVVNVLIDDGLPVEYGQVLFEIAARPIA